MEIFLIFILIVISLLLFLRWYGLKNNEADWGNTFANVCDGLIRRYCRSFHRLEMQSLRVPKTGGAILVSNHMSGLDPFILISCSDRPLRFIIAKEEYERPILWRLFKAAGCIPVDRQGRVDKAFREAKRGIERGEIVALFPHGKIHLDHEKPYRIKSGMVRLAQMCDVPVIPVRLEGIKAQGSVFTSLLLRADTKITHFPVFTATDTHKQNFENEFGKMLLGLEHDLEIDC